MSSKILAVIDDEPEMEDIYSLILEPMLEDGSLEMKFFEDGRIFLHWLENHTPDLIFCDINMPHMDGIALCRRVRDAKQDLPIVLISGDSPEEHVKALHELKIAHYITKPVTPQEVLNLCGEHFTLHEPAIS